MKKLLSLLFAVFLMPCCVFANAEARIETHSPTQMIAIPVTFFFNQADGTTQTIILDFNAYTLNWDFELLRNNKTGDYNGFRFDLEHFVSFTPVAAEASIAPFSQLVEADITIRKTPDRKITCSPLDGSCTVEFSGGCYEVTYTSAFHFSACGELLEVEQCTIQQSFDFSEQFAAHTS